MEWISLKVCPRSHFDGQGDVSHLPTRLAETEAPVLPLCPLRAHSIPSGSRQTRMCTLQLPSNLSPLACQSQKQTTSNPKEKPTCCVKRQVVADCPLCMRLLQSQRPSPLCPVLVYLYIKKESAQFKHFAESNMVLSKPVIILHILNC